MRHETTHSFPQWLTGTPIPLPTIHYEITHSIFPKCLNRTPILFPNCLTNPSLFIPFPHRSLLDHPPLLQHPFFPPQGFTETLIPVSQVANKESTFFSPQCLITTPIPFPYMAFPKHPSIIPTIPYQNSPPSQQFATRAPTLSPHTAPSSRPLRLDRSSTGQRSARTQHDTTFPVRKENRIRPGRQIRPQNVTASLERTALHDHPTGARTRGGFSRTLSACLSDWECA